MLDHAAKTCKRMSDVIAQLGSDHDGIRLASIHALTGILEKHGLGFRDFGDIVARAMTSAKPKIEPPAMPSTLATFRASMTGDAIDYTHDNWEALNALIVSLAAKSGHNPRDTEFLTNMVAAVRVTKSQLKWLCDIEFRAAQSKAA
jgi:ketopantoate reductase